jgi:hypothetical protein
MIFAYLLVALVIVAVLAYFIWVLATAGKGSR